MALDLSRGVSRREWIRLLAAGAGLGAVASQDGIAGLAVALQRGDSAAQPLRFPRGAIVRTLLKDLPPEALATGATLFHEHLSINLAGLAGPGRGGQTAPGSGAATAGGQAAPAQAPPPQGGAAQPQAGQATAAGRQGGPPLPPITDNVDLMVELVNKAGREGVSCIVDGGHADMGRKLADLKTIASRTSVLIVASGGFYMGRTYPPEIAAKSDDQIAEDLAREAQAGRFGAFGEIGENPNGAELTLDERKVFRAIGKAHVRTGIPIFTHNSYGTGPNVPLGMRDTAFYVPKEKLARLARVHTEAPGGGLTVDENRPDPTVVPLGPSGGGGLFSTAMDYARFCEMLLGGGQLNGVRILAPRTVAMMRTNHVNPEPLKTMAAGTGWGMDFNVVMDAAAAGEPYSNGSYHWYGIAGTWFWIDPVEDFAFIGMLQHQNLAAARQVHALSRNLVYQAIVN